jgi:hypothetical protein
MNVIRISIRITIPTSLHAHLIGIQNRKIHIIQWPITPETGSVAVGPLLQLVVVANICEIHRQLALLTT